MPQKPRSWIFPAIMSLLFLSLPFLPLGNFQGLSLMLGRTHPLIIHFPIVLVILTLIFEHSKGHLQSHHIQTISSNLYSLSLYSAVLAVVVGYLLYQSGDYEGEFVIRHLWGGILLAILLTWARFFQRTYQQTKRWRSRQIYRLLIFSAVLNLVYTSHLGGSITHGPEYLTEPFKDMIYARQLSRAPANKNPSSLIIYEDIISPILRDKCGKCHNNASEKGGLNLSSYDKMLECGKSEKPCITPGDAANSELLVRVTLPEDHDDFMPPDGKTPMRPDEIQLLRWWINEGGNPTDTLGEGPEDSLVNESLQSILPSVAEAQVAKQLSRLERLKMSPKLIKLGVELGLQIHSDPESDSTYYTVAMQIPPKHVTDRELSKLMPYRHLFSKVSLVSADISDEGLFYLGQMPNLREVILIKCCIKGEGLVHLTDLSKLQLLNLSYTDVDNLNAMRLTSFENLKEVYLFNTFVDQQLINLLNDYMSNTEVSIKEGPYY